MCAVPGQDSTVVTHQADHLFGKTASNGESSDTATICAQRFVPATTNNIPVDF
jgi:hypothetical protein